MKKVLSLGLVILILGAFAACSKQPSPEGDTSAASSTSTASASVSADNESQDPDSSQASADFNDLIDFEEPEPLPPAPYKGMPESEINSTQLGSYTTKEQCTDFYHLKPRRRWVEYRWFQSGIQDSEHLKCVAQISYWDYKEKRQVDGYVLSVSVFN